MSLPNKKGWLAILFIIFCLAIPFGITYYVSMPASQARYEGWRTRGRGIAANVKLTSRVSAKQLLLVKNDRVKIKNTCLVFRGLEKGEVMLDLYLLELDPGYAYPQRFSRDNNGDAIRLGDVTYTVASANNYSLTLKVLQAMGAY